MGRIIIWGSSKLATYTADVLSNKYDAYICDNKIETFKKLKRYKLVHSKDLYSNFDIKKDIVLISSKSAKSCYEIMNQVENIGFENIGIIKPRVEKFGLPIDLENKCEIAWYCYKGKKNRLIPRLEINIVDGCNLNCEGCTHFSSLYSKESVCTLNSLEKDLKRMREIGQIVRLRLLGGEPFLIKNIDEYASIARALLPETDIEIVTNGLLIPMVEKKSWSSIRENNIGIAISPYRPTVAIKDKIQAVLTDNEINYSFEGNYLDMFTKNLTLSKKHNGKISSSKCLSSGCIFLRNGKIYKCPFEGLIGDFSEYYKLDTRIEYSGIDIYEENESEIYNNIKKVAVDPVDMCSYCSEDIQYFQWRCNPKPKLEDWLYGENINKDEEVYE